MANDAPTKRFTKQLDTRFLGAFVCFQTDFSLRLGFVFCFLDRRVVLSKQGLDGNQLHGPFFNLVLGRPHLRAHRMRGQQPNTPQLKHRRKGAAGAQNMPTGAYLAKRSIPETFDLFHVFPRHVLRFFAALDLVEVYSAKQKRSILVLTQPAAAHAVLELSARMCV